MMRFNPNGSLSRGLVSLVLFEQSLNASLDFVRPYQSTSPLGANGPTVATSPSMFGGGQVSTDGNGSDFVNFATPTVTLGTKYTFSFLAQYSGVDSSTFTGAMIVACDAGEANGIGIANATDQFDIFGTTNIFFAATSFSTMTGWHRVTIGTNATNCLFYLDGVHFDTQTGAGQPSWTVDLMAVGWPWPIADLFIWNRMITAAEARAHFIDPYGTTMMPNGEEFLIKGQANAATAISPSLLTTGVGP